LSRGCESLNHSRQYREIVLAVELRQLLHDPRNFAIAIIPQGKNRFGKPAMEINSLGAEDLLPISENGCSSNRTDISCNYRWANFWGGGGQRLRATLSHSVPLPWYA